MSTIPTRPGVAAAAIAVLAALTTLGVGGAEQDFADSFAGPIEAAHGAAAWRSRPAVSARLALEMGESSVLSGRLLFAPDMSGTRLELADGTVAVWDGAHAWVSPAAAEFPGARFHLLTWPYFLAAPMKLRDPGVHLEPLGERTLRGVTYDAARMTFAPGTGDTPEDWYVLYRDRATQRLAAMAYIVTYGKSRATAEAAPHAITFEDYAMVEGVAIPTTWRLWHWSAADGISGEPLGRVLLEEVGFPAPGPDAFSRPADAREDPLPASGED